MTCPMFKDYTRGCIEFFQEVAYLENFDVCQSKEEYKNCICYKFTITPEEKFCKHIKTCREIETGINDDSMVKKVMSIAINYCITDDKINCAVYKLLEKGKELPKGLLCDGSKIVLKSH